MLLREAETDASFLVRGMTPGVRRAIPITGYLILGASEPLLVDAGKHVEVALESRLAIITGDSAYLIEPSFTEQIPPGYFTSIEDTMRALRDIRRRADHVLPMYDPVVYERYPDDVR